MITDIDGNEIKIGSLCIIPSAVAQKRVWKVIAVETGLKGDVAHLKEVLGDEETFRFYNDILVIL